MTNQSSPKAPFRDQRGVSEAVSFLLLFAILLGVSITGAVFGIESLDTASRGEASVSAHRSLEAVRADMYDLSTGASYRSTDLRLSGGTLRYAQPIAITITATTGTETMEPVTLRVVPIVADTDLTEFRLVSGAILLHQADGGVVRVAPRLRIDEQQSIMSLMNTSHGDGPAGVGGTGAISVVSYRESDQVRRFDPVDATGSPALATVKMTVVSPRPSVWYRFFVIDTRFDKAVMDESMSTASAEFRTRRLFIKATDVRVRFDD